MKDSLSGPLKHPHGFQINCLHVHRTVNNNLILLLKKGFLQGFPQANTLLGLSCLLCVLQITKLVLKCSMSQLFNPKDRPSTKQPLYYSEIFSGPSPLIPYSVLVEAKCNYWQDQIQRQSVICKICKSRTSAQRIKPPREKAFDLYRRKQK